MLSINSGVNVSINSLFLPFFIYRGSEGYRFDPCYNQKEVKKTFSKAK